MSGEGVIPQGTVEVFFQETQMLESQAQEMAIVFDFHISFWEEEVLNYYITLSMNISWIGGLYEERSLRSLRKVQFSSVQLCLTLCDAMDCSMPGFPSITISQSLLKLMSIKSVMPFSHLILCHPFLLLSLFPSIRVFFKESALHIRWPKYWSFSFSISPSNEHSGLISFRMDWLDLLVGQGALKSLLQHHTSKA